MNLEQYDKWVIANQKKILDWTRKFDKKRYAPIRDAFSAYHKAKSNKQKISSFDRLKDELKLSSGKSFSELIDTQFKPTMELLQKVADDHTNGDIEALNRNSNFAKELSTYDDLSPLYEATSSIPSKEEGYDWVEIDKAYEDNYNVKELTALAAKYGYDYTDKKERSEFLSKIAEIEKQKNIDKAFSLDPNASKLDQAAHIITDLAYPITKNYVRKNWQNIEGKSDLIKPMLADVAVAELMTGPFRFKWKPGATIANNTVAPLVRQGAEVGINDKPLEDAAKDFVGESVTNFATPVFVEGAKSKLSNMMGNEKQKTAQAMLNEAANKARAFENEFISGTPIVKVVTHDDGTKSLKYFVYGGKKKLVKEVPDHIARKMSNGKTLSWKDFEEWQKIGYTRKENSLSTLPKTLRDEEEKKILAAEKRGAEKAMQNELDGKPWHEGLDAIEAAGATNLEPEESLLNWTSEMVTNSKIGNDLANLWNNQLGRTQYAGRTINTFGRLVPGGENLDWFSSKDSKKKTLSEQDKMEFEMLNRMRKLHKDHPELYDMPKLPEKFKDLVNASDWYESKPISISDIFGGE